jgi:hypothetical protein
MNEKIAVEMGAAAEALRLLARDRKQYTKQIAGMYVCNLVFRNLTMDDARLARAAYFYARHIDDALDGEHSGYPNLKTAPRELPINISELDKSRHPIARLGRYALRGLSDRQKPGDAPVEDMQRLIDSMVFDYERSQTGGTFKNEAALLDYFGDMARGTNLLLTGFRSRLREDTDLPHFAIGTGRVQSARDLRDDWVARIYNVPSDVLSDIYDDFEPGSCVPTYDVLVMSPGFEEWQADQLNQARAELLKSRDVAASIGKNDSGARVIALRAEQTLRYIPKIIEGLHAVA